MRDKKRLDVLLAVNTIAAVLTCFQFYLFCACLNRGLQRMLLFQKLGHSIKRVPFPAL